MVCGHPWEYEKPLSGSYIPEVRRMILSSASLSTVNSSTVRSQAWRSSTPSRLGFWLARSCRACACNYSFCEFMFVIAMSFSEVSIPQYFFPSSSFYTPSSSSSGMFSEPHHSIFVRNELSVSFSHYFSQLCSVYWQMSPSKRSFSDQGWA